MKKKIKILITIVVGLLLLAFLGTSIIIGLDIQQSIDLAVMRFPGDAVEALSSYVDSEVYSLETRNSAIWALGQIGDARALPILIKLYTGEPCDHEKRICQYELKKAIKYCEGGFNATRFIWKPFVLKTDDEQKAVSGI